MIRTRRMLLVIVAALGGLAPVAHAQGDDVRVSAGVSSSTAYVGDALRYTISVESEAEPQRPVVEASGFDALDAGQSRRQSLEIINGRQRQSISTDFHYHLRPLRAGALEIPPVEVEVDGRTYRTQAVWIEARRPEQTDDFRVVIRPEKTTCSVGEPVALDITFSFQLRVRDFWPSLAIDDSRARLDPSPSLSSLPRSAGRQQPQALEIELNGQTVRGFVGDTELDGRRFGTFTFQMIATPTEAGSLQVGPVTIALDEIIGEERPGFFDSPFRDRTRTRRVVIASDPVTLDVRPLPAAGRPDGFTGLVGRYDLLVTADRESANVGDPIELSLRIRGPEPMLNVRPPSLETAQIATNFRTDSAGWRRTGATPGERQYSTTVRARSAEAPEFPALELPYFDPEAGEYRIARSQPAPLRIRPTSVVTAADAEFGPAPAAATLRQRLSSGPSGLLANPPASEALAARAPALALGQMAPALGVAIALPPALCAVLLAARLRRERSQAPSRRAGLRAARRRLRGTGDDPAAAAGALQAWFGAALGVEPGAITPDDGEAAIGPHDRDLAGRVATLMRDCDAARYRPGGVADRSLRSRAEALIRELAREGLPR